MSLDTKVKNLIINTNMTKEQYEAIDDKSNQLFFVEDSSVVDVPAPEENKSGYLHTDGTNLTWEEIESGDKLPDQTDNAGKFLTTDGTTASWGEALVNLGAGNKNSLWLGSGTLSGSVNDAIVLYTGLGFVSAGNGSIAIGTGQSTGYYSICIGGSNSAGNYAIQLGGRFESNPDANTFKVGNNNGNFEMMDANGKVPLDRLTYVTDQIGDISTVLDSINGETLEG